MEKLEELLIELYDLHSVIRMREEEMRDLLPPGYLENLEKLRQEEKSLAERIRREAIAILELGQSVSASGLAVTVAKRVTWSDDLLSGYALGHPEILAARKETICAVITEGKAK